MIGAITWRGKCHRRLAPCRTETSSRSYVARNAATRRTAEGDGSTILDPTSDRKNWRITIEFNKQFKVKSIEIAERSPFALQKEPNRRCERSQNALRKEPKRAMKEAKTRDERSPFARASQRNRSQRARRRPRLGTNLQKNMGRMSRRKGADVRKKGSECAGERKQMCGRKGAKEQEEGSGCAEKRERITASRRYPLIIFRNRTRLVRSGIRP